MTFRSKKIADWRFEKMDIVALVSVGVHLFGRSPY